MNTEKIRFDNDQLKQLNELLNDIGSQLVNLLILGQVAENNSETPTDFECLNEFIRSAGKTFSVLENKQTELVKAIENYQSQVDELKKAYADLKQDNYELKGLVPLSFHRKEFQK